MTDLAKHIFDMGVAMNRVAAMGVREAAVAAAVRADADSASMEELTTAERIIDDVERGACGPDPWWCPPEIKDSLERYHVSGIPTGGFLRAVLENNLMDAVGRADGTNVRYLPGIASYVYNQLPTGSHGSVARVAEWIRDGGAQGRAVLAEAGTVAAEGPLP